MLHYQKKVVALLYSPLHSRRAIQCSHHNRAIQDSPLIRVTREFPEQSEIIQVQQWGTLKQKNKLT